jgi:glycerophosphoryl diester phosphodiesterase
MSLNAANISIRTISRFAAFAGMAALAFCCWQPSAAEPSAGKPHISAVIHRPQVISHRGGRKWAPENTIVAFKKSLDVHADGIELDIHRCKSGELVVIHDENVGRTTNGTGLVKDLTYAELRRLGAGAWFHSEFKSEHLPLLSEVLELIDGKALLNIEIKNAPVGYPGIDDDLIKLLATYKHADKIVISSFDHELLQRIHKKAPQYKVAILVDGLLVDLGKYASIVGAKSWNPGFELIRADNVAQAHKDGLEVNVWTVNKPEQWKAAVEMGVDGIITDNPKGLLEYLDKRGATGK